MARVIVDQARCVATGHSMRRPGGRCSRQRALGGCRSSSARNRTTNPWAWPEASQYSPPASSPRSLIPYSALPRLGPVASSGSLTAGR
jgi:hypothetical protein